MSWSLMDSQLIGFRSPSFSPSCVVCTVEIANRIEELTELADSTSHVNISCLPNIWSPAHAYKPSTDTFVQKMAELSATPSYTSSHSEVPEALTMRAFRGHEKELSSNFELHPRSKFFVIKSFSEEDVEAAMKHSIWTSTRLGNERLHAAYTNLADGDIYLLFLVNGSSRFCGAARMAGPVDFTKESDIWAEATRWKGIFPVEWLVINEVPNWVFENLRVPANGNKSVTKSRDTQEVLFSVGHEMLRIFGGIRH